MNYRADSRPLTAGTPDEIHPQLDPTPILMPLPKHTSTQVSPRVVSPSQPDADPAVIYAVCASSTASLGSAHLGEPHGSEVVTLVSRHSSSKTSLNSRPGETHV